MRIDDDEMSLYGGARIAHPLALEDERFGGSVLLSNLSEPILPSQVALFTALPLMTQLLVLSQFLAVFVVP